MPTPLCGRPQTVLDFILEPIGATLRQSIIAGRAVEKPFDVGEDAHAGINCATTTRVIIWLIDIARLLTHSFITMDVPTLNSLNLWMPHHGKRFQSLNERRMAPTSCIFHQGARILGEGSGA